MKKNKTHTTSNQRILLLLLLITVAGTQYGKAQESDSIALSKVGTTKDSTVNAMTDTKVIAEDVPYVPDTVTFRKVPDNTVKQLQSKKIYAYANDPEYWLKEKPRDEDSFLDRMFRALGSGLIRYLFYIILITVLGFVIYRIAVVNKMYLFYKPKAFAGNKEEKAADEIYGDTIDSDISQAIASKDFRQATRLLYLKGLKLLQDKKLINYNAEATNWEYVIQLGKHPCADNFRKITRAYEYVWYGEFDLAEEQFEQIKPLFQQFYAEV